jgi:hypothetical protein
VRGEQHLNVARYEIGGDDESTVLNSSVSSTETRCRALDFILPSHSLHDRKAVSKNISFMQIRASSFQSYELGVYDRPHHR